MIVENEYTVKLSEIGKDNKVTNKALLSYLEDVAGMHSDIAGYGVREIFETNLTWILLEWKLEVVKRPKYHEKIIVKTWSKGCEKFYTYRDFEGYDENGNLILRAASKWVLIDIQKGKIIRVSDEILNKYETEITKNTFEVDPFSKISEPEEYQYETQYTVRRADIDVNNHMHNLNYIELANEALPVDVYKGALFNDVRIFYKKEIKFGDTVKCKYYFHEDKHAIAIKSLDETILHAIIELK